MVDFYVAPTASREAAHDSRIVALSGWRKPMLKLLADIRHCIQMQAIAAAVGFAGTIRRRRRHLRGLRQAAAEPIRKQRPLLTMPDQPQQSR
jgi:hypothetical protein